MSTTTTILFSEDLQDLVMYALKKMPALKATTLLRNAMHAKGMITDRQQDCWHESIALLNQWSVEDVLGCMYFEDFCTNHTVRQYASMVLHDIICDLRREGYEDSDITEVMDDLYDVIYDRAEDWKRHEWEKI